VELEASARANVEKWMAGFKKAPPPKKSAKELEAEHKMLRSLAEPKTPLPSDYKCTMQNLYCAKMSDDILQNEDKQMLKFYQEARLSVKQLHDQLDIQMLYAPRAWEIGEPMIDEKHFNNNMQTRIFHQWYLQQVKVGRQMFGFQYKHQYFYHGDGEQWIMCDEMHSLLKGGELKAQIICLWELYVLCLSSS
jgi:hypothetical protein